MVLHNKKNMRPGTITFFHLGLGANKTQQSVQDRFWQWTRTAVRVFRATVFEELDSDLYKP